MYYPLRNSKIENGNFIITHEGKEITLTPDELNDAYYFQAHLYYLTEIKDELVNGVLNPVEKGEDNDEFAFIAADEKLAEALTNDSELIEDLATHMEKDIYKYNASAEDYFEDPENYEEMFGIILDRANELKNSLSDEITAEDIRNYLKTLDDSEMLETMNKFLEPHCSDRYFDRHDMFDYNWANQGAYMQESSFAEDIEKFWINCYDNEGHSIQGDITMKQLNNLKYFFCEYGEQHNCRRAFSRKEDVINDFRISKQDIQDLKKYYEGEAWSEDEYNELISAIKGVKAEQTKAQSKGIGR